MTAYIFAVQKGQFKMKRRLKDDYSFLSYYFLGAITLGIYNIWYLHNLTRDLNVICSDTGKKTSGVLKHILLSIVTFGAYSVFWWYRIADMLDEQAKKRDLNVEINGKIVMLCMLLSYIGFGLPSIYVCYRTFEAMNEVALDYNSKLIDKRD